MLKTICDWIPFKLNVPHSSNMGGTWERMIRTVRNALEPLLLQAGSQLDEETLRTLLTEVECIIDSRPLSVDNLCDAKAPEPLTPNHLLNMKPKRVLPPPGKFQRADMYCSRRWRTVQYFANEFFSCYTDAKGILPLKRLSARGFLHLVVQAVLIKLKLKKIL